MKNFAKLVYDDHTRSTRQLEQLGRATRTPDTRTPPPETGVPAPPTPGTPRSPGVTETDQGAGAMLESMQEQTMSQLESATGEDFDRVFLDGQVSSHQHALDVLQRLQARVQDEQLRQHLTRTISTVQQHLQQAQQLQGSVGTGGTWGDTALSR